MNEWIIAGCLVTALALCALLVSFYALYRAHQISHNAKAAAEEAREEAATTLEAMRSRIEGAVSEIQETPVPRQVVEPIPGTPKSCMNLTRRSQALRLRRKGESAEKIAQALSMPRQEVELLLKVHEIVLNTL